MLRRRENTLWFGRHRGYAEDVQSHSRQSRPARPLISPPCKNIDMNSMQCGLGHILLQLVLRYHCRSIRVHPNHEIGSILFFGRRRSLYGWGGVIVALPVLLQRCSSIHSPFMLPMLLEVAPIYERDPKQWRRCKSGHCHCFCSNTS